MVLPFSLEQQQLKECHRKEMVSQQAHLLLLHLFLAIQQLLTPWLIVISVAMGLWFKVPYHFCEKFTDSVLIFDVFWNCDDFLFAGGPPRPPLIRPPTFFGATPSSTIRQRGPPPTRGSRGSLSHRVVHSGHVDNASSSKQTYVALENVPESCSDQDIVAFLDIKPSKMSKCMLHL